MTDIKCPVCQTNAALIEPEGGYDYGRHKGYKCHVCGPYFITGTAEVEISNKKPGPKLSAWIREHQENSQNPPGINSYLLDSILENLPHYRPLEKQLILLRAIERRTSYPGAKASLNREADYPLAWANNADELGYLLKSMEERRFIEQDKVIGSPTWNMVIMTEGWEYLDRFTSQPAFKNRAFVAMSFDKALEPAWKHGIEPAVDRAGYKPYRVDKEPHIDRIDAKIIADIKDSKFLIADVTQQKQGVYFEAGYALGLKLPVLWCVRENHLKKVHFDTRQYNHIVWKTPEDLQEKLYNLICAVIGKREASTGDGTPS